jgi:hypothetical protein
MAWLSGSAESVAKVRLQQPKIVMPGLDPVIHAAEDVYGRAKPGSRTFLESAAASGFVETARGHDDLWCLVADGDSARMCKNLSRMAWTNGDDAAGELPVGNSYGDLGARRSFLFTNS